MSALDLQSGDAQVFVEKAWATRTHLHRADPADLAGLLSLDDVDHLLTSSGFRTPALRIAIDGKVLPESTFTRRGASIAGKPLTGLVDVGRVLRLFDEGAGKGLEDTLALEAQLQGEATQTEDFAEGVAAFLEKRPPSFSGS